MQEVPESVERFVSRMFLDQAFRATAEQLYSKAERWDDEHRLLSFPSFDSFDLCSECVEQAECGKAYTWESYNGCTGINRGKRMLGGPVQQKGR